ncbi:MAG: hypothetical protein ACLTT1_06880 [[Clostridium] scindens]
MLHILLLILKIIGIILAVILGILVLFVCESVLFVPIRYEARPPDVRVPRDTLSRPRVKATWLFHLIRAVAGYYRNRKAGVETCGSHGRNMEERTG